MKPITPGANRREAEALRTTASFLDSFGKRKLVDHGKEETGVMSGFQDGLTQAWISSYSDLVLESGIRQCQGPGKNLGHHFWLRKGRQIAWCHRVSW